jgi:hypothetical protein
MTYLGVQQTQGSHARLVYKMSHREMECLIATLRYYPQLDPHVQTLSKNSGNTEAQQLLEEVMSGQRQSRCRTLDQFLQNDSTFEQVSHDDIRLALPHAEVEWLLQILNEVRVCSWISLGRPESDDTTEYVNEMHQRYRSAMELSAFFELALLKAFADQ